MEMTTLGSLIALQRGYDLTETQRRAGPVPVVGSAGIHGYHDVARAKGPGVTLGRSGASFGRVTFVREDFWPHNTTVFVTDFKGNDPGFIHYLLESLDFSSLNSGSAQQSLNRNFVYPVPAPRFSLAAQQRIARILSAYDELIENSQRRIRILEAMARALYREWFVHFRFPGHENVARVASRLGEIPKGWDVATIGDVCERVTDGSHSSPKSVDDGLPMASSKDMDDWSLTLEKARLISREDFADLLRNDCRPKQGDVLITKDGANYLKYVFVTRAEQEVVLLSSIAMLRPNRRINPHLLAATLKNPENKDRLKNYVTGAAIPRVVLKDFKRFEFVLPPESVQVQWAKIAEPITGLCWQLADQGKNLRRTRDLLLPRLISGEVEIFS